MGKTEQLVILKNCGVLSALINHVKVFKDYQNEDVLGQTLWAISNFAVDNQQFRSFLI